LTFPHLFGILESTNKGIYKMSTTLRNVPNLDTTTKLTQNRFWGGVDRKQCVQITQLKPRGFDKANASDGMFNFVELTREQARELAVELMLFAEGREVEEV
jgi:hypothetical protein|tara:strand:- start:751 stop:1053 length:303 start_codon:yes stop_codon:yes gene_type:complete